jgi:predicted nucleotidyltransferase
MQKHIPEGLPALARIFDEWIAPAPGVNAVYLFGSRIRGDHRPDSDIDVQMYIERWHADEATVSWWETENESNFAWLKLQLPCIPDLNRDPLVCDEEIARGDKNPVFVAGRVRCVWTPPK